MDGFHMKKDIMDFGSGYPDNQRGRATTSEIWG